MKINKIEIKNFKSLKNITIYPKDILALVGRNNSGKSNIIKALELFFSGSIKLVNNECFYKHIISEPIEIFLSFERLTEWEEKKFEPWMNEDKLIIGKEIACNGEDSYEIINIAIVKTPEPEWLRVDEINGANILNWWSNKDLLKINGLDFLSRLGSSRPTVSKWREEASQFVIDNKDKISFIEAKRKNPQGYPNILKGALPEFIYIPAVKDVTDEAKVAKTNPFGQLINSIIEKFSIQDKDKIADKIKDIERRLNRSGGNDRLKEISEIEDNLNKLISDIMDCDLEIEITMPKLVEVFSGAKIYANDGIRTLIENKGHGLQRSVIFTILREYASLMHIKKAEEQYTQRTTIFAIEEPELYLHPQSQRTLMKVFKDIATSNDQIIYATHSSLFIDISLFDQICILKKEKKEQELYTCCNQLSIALLLEDLKVRKGIEGTTEGIRAQYFNAFNVFINEGFFADKVVIVEGPSEFYSLPIYAQALGYDFDKNNISVVHSDGKGRIDRLLRIFNGFKIPTFIIFDGDKNSDDANVKKETLELLELLNKPIKNIDEADTIVYDNFSMFEDNFEEYLKNEISEYERIKEETGKRIGSCGKPLHNKFIALHLLEKIKREENCDANNIIPRTIIEIIDNIKKLDYSKSILKDLSFTE